MSAQSLGDTCCVPTALAWLALVCWLYRYRRVLAALANVIWRDRRKRSLYSQTELLSLGFHVPVNAKKTRWR